MTLQTQLRRREAATGVELPAELSPLLRRLYLSRGVKDSQELERSVRGMLPYQQLDGIDDAVKLLQKALTERLRIIIVGDFDADGATSTALALLSLRSMGCGNIDFLVPNRFEDGYGLSPEVVEQAASRGAELILTVDNGISSHAGVTRRTRRIQVLVTDHHLPGETLPDAEAIINPNLHGCAFPSKSLAGVGVAFYLMLALRSALRDSGWFEQYGITPPNLAEHLDLVALGTVADVVPLDANNRIMVYQGLNAFVRANVALVYARCWKSRPRSLTLGASDLGLRRATAQCRRALDDSCRRGAVAHGGHRTSARTGQRLDALNQTARELSRGCRLRRWRCAIKLERGTEPCRSGWRCTIRNGIRAWSAYWLRACKNVLTAR